jgi:membrane protein YqaA with SNARE-associated domain
LNLSELGEYGYWGLFIGSFLAATIFPFSSEIILSFMLYKNYDLATCLIVATAGNWLGGLTGYGLGYLAKLKWLEKYFRVKHADLLKFQAKVERHGSKIAFFSWIPFIGDPLGIALGFFKVHFYKVAVWMLIGKAFRYVLWGFLFLKGMKMFL